MSDLTEIRDMRAEGLEWGDILDALTAQGVPSAELEGPEGLFAIVRLQEEAGEH